MYSCCLCFLIFLLCCKEFLFLSELNIHILEQAPKILPPTSISSSSGEPISTLLANLKFLCPYFQVSCLYTRFLIFFFLFMVHCWLSTMTDEILASFRPHPHLLLYSGFLTSSLLLPPHVPLTLRVLCDPRSVFPEYRVCAQCVISWARWHTVIPWSVLYINFVFTWKI